MNKTPAIEAVGYGISGDIGGLPKTTYYTPDGRVVKTHANFHVNSAGQTRDANLDTGWLLSPPVNPKLFCRWCDRWHDTEGEVDACHRQRNFLVEKEMVKAKQEETNEMLALKNEVSELKAMLSKFMEVQNGKVFQSEVNESTPVSTEQGVGAAKEGL